MVEASKFKIQTIHTHMQGAICDQEHRGGEHGVGHPMSVATSVKRCSWAGGGKFSLPLQIKPCSYAIKGFLAANSSSITNTQQLNANGCQQKQNCTDCFWSPLHLCKTSYCSYLKSHNLYDSSRANPVSYMHRLSTS